VALRGNLRDFTLTQLLNLINLAKKTGALTLGEGTSQATVYFREGMLVHASLDGQAPNLRNLLGRVGKINEAQSRLLPQEARSEKEWGLLLINTGLINRADIIEAVRRHTLETVYRLFTWTEESFLFEPNVLPPDDKITVLLHLENVILEGSRRVAEWKRLEQELPDLGMALGFTAQPEVRLKRIELSPDEWRVVSSIDPSRSIQEIAQAHSLTDFQIRKIVYGLLSAGLVELIPRVKPVFAAPPPEEKIAPAPVRRGIILRLIDRIRRL
jgi:hypothetical protein